MLTPTAPFPALHLPPSQGGGISVTDRDGLGIATVLARKGCAGALSQRIREHFHIELPRGPRRASVRDTAFLGTGPDAWLATKEQGGNPFARELQTTLGDLAAVADQSDAYAVLRLTGIQVRQALCKFIPVDLDARAFRTGEVALTVATHIAVTLWRLDDAPDGAAVFEIAVYRSLAGSFWRVLSESAAEFGLSIISPESAQHP